jgi:hypothetical protein
MQPSVSLGQPISVPLAPPQCREQRKIVLNPGPRLIAWTNPQRVERRSWDYHKHGCHGCCDSISLSSVPLVFALLSVVASQSFLEITCICRLLPRTSPASAIARPIAPRVPIRIEIQTPHRQLRRDVPEFFQAGFLTLTSIFPSHQSLEFDLAAFGRTPAVLLSSH